MPKKWIALGRINKNKQAEVIIHFDSTPRTITLKQPYVEG